ncbi:MAG: hypothetical protein AAGD11_15470 [Planctomycetota bacterium]
MDFNPTDDRAKPPETAAEAVLEQADELIWALLDDRIETADVKKLEDLLRESQPVRDRYIQCVQMHCELYQHFGEDLPPAELPKSPVLGSLGDLRPGTDTLPLRD